jgi:hypothetical protein
MILDRLPLQASKIVTRTIIGGVYKKAGIPKFDLGIPALKLINTGNYLREFIQAAILSASARGTWGIGGISVA